MNIKELNEAIDKALKEDGNGLLKLSDNLINRLTFGYLGSEDKLPRFNSLEDLEEYIKSTNSFPDNFFYQDALFTMDEYDMDGKYLSYGCPQLDKGITVRTPDGRYNYKGNYAELEMEIEESDGWSYRFDLTYYLPKEVYLALYNKSESSKKSIKEEMEYNRKIWDLFEENIAEYLNEHGVKPDGNNVMNYISENAAEIVKAVLEKEYNYEEDDQAIFELYYNCPIHFTDKAQAVDKLLEEYLAESLKRCLTIEDKLLQISSLDKNESVTDKKSIKEAVSVSDIDDLAKDYFQPYMTYNEYKNGKYNAYMVWNTDLVYISEGGAKSEIIGASSKRELKGKIAAIRTYEYEKQYGRNEQGEPPTLATTKGLFKK